jgi:hypothetical protein
MFFTASIFEADGLTPVTLSDVPEPSSIGMSLAGLAVMALGGIARKTFERV